MKLKNKVLLSFLSVVMLLLLFGFVDMCAAYANKFVEKRITYSLDSETVDLRYSLASAVKVKEGYIVSAEGDGYVAKSDSDEFKSESLQELISLIEVDESEIIFDSVSSFKNLLFTKNVTLGGELTFNNANLISTSEKIIIDGLKLRLFSGSVQVRLGDFEVRSGEITSDSSLFLLDYNSASSLTINGGTLSTSTIEPAIISSLGSVKISGGSISNDFGPAIRNKATLTLCNDPQISGFGFDIKTDTPINLSDGNRLLQSEINVMYNAVFERGTKTLVCRYANSKSIDYINMFDAEGEEIDLTFFDSAEYFDEKDFLAVYLPYTVKFYSDSTLYTTEYFLKSEVVQAPEMPTKEGYKFDGWYQDSTLKEAYNFASAKDFDFLLFAKFTLLPPEFEINSKSFVYDRREHILSFDKLYHPLAEYGSFSFEWFKNSEVIPYCSDKVSITDVSDSGSYKCKLTFSYNGDFITVTTPIVDVNIEKAVVKKPEISQYTYTGSYITPNVEDSELYTFDFALAKNVGVYTVTFQLTDFENYRWSDGTEKYAVSTYEIIRAENGFLSVPVVRNCFSGASPEVIVSVKFGEAKILYSLDGINFTSYLPSAPGEYYLKISVAGSENYFSLESEAFVFKVFAEIPIGIKVDKAPDKVDYSAFETLVLDGAEFSVTYNSGRVEKIDNSLLEIRYKKGDCFLAEDSCATVFFGSVSVPLTVNISLAEYDMGSVVFEDASTVYNGKRQTLSAFCDIVGKDGYPLRFKVSGGGINVGEYTVTLSFDGDSLNYKIPDSIERKLVILPYEISVSFGEIKFVYDGSPKVPSAIAFGAGGLILPLTVTGAATDAGLYVAKATLPDGNYVLKNAETTFEILKANLDLSSVFWSSESFIYTGKPQSVSISGLPLDVIFVGYTDSSFIDVGEYIATASIIYDTENYNAPEPLIHRWRILPADYDFSNCFFLDAEYIYDGKCHYPKFVGKLPEGADGSIPEYTYSGAAVHVSEGIVKITVSFSTASKNYNKPSDLVAYVKINPKPINVFWEDLSFVYDGAKHMPKASAAECDIRVVGASMDAGRYTASAYTDNTDYSITNPTVDFVIAKADNCWIIAPSVGTQFEGKVPVPYATAAFGEVLYVYYSDSELLTPISTPTAAGRYYMVAYVPEGKNYNYLSFSPIEFNVIEVLAVSFTVEINNESLIAKHKLSDEDISAYLINNDGSKTKLTISEINVEYQNGDTLLVGDEKIVFSYGSFWASYDIVVEKARYDMSLAFWDKTEATFSGERIASLLSGLPAGVSVKEYVLNSGIYAGEYQLSAVLSYDSENYYEPIVPLATLTINKRSVEIPEIPTVIYDGSFKGLGIPENAPYRTDFTGAVHAGVYEVHFTLVDDENYCFAGESVKIFEILKRSITVEILKNGKGYSLTLGSIIDGDELNEEYYTEDGMVYMRISNPDYELTVIPIKKENNALWAFLIVVLLAVLTLLAIWIVYRRWDNIVLVFSGIMDKRKSNFGTSAELFRNSGKENKSAPEPPLETLLAVDEAHANSLITDSLAKSLVTDFEISIEIEGRKKSIINIDTISENYSAGDVVDINSLKEKRLIPRDAGKIKVLARGVIDKPLTVVANSFSLSAVKMIALTGGAAKRAHTFKKKR